MKLSNTKSSLAYLYKIVEAGELGYAVVASNVKNRALKYLFQSYAQQRREFKDEILAELHKIDVQYKPEPSLPSMLGMIHRGRIDIFAHFTIGDENVEQVLFKEIMVGERAAIRVYDRTLKQDLPYEIRPVLERQFQEVEKVVEQIHLLRGENGKRLLMRLYNTKPDAEEAVQSLKQEGIQEEKIEIENFMPAHIEPYSLRRGRATAIFETVLSAIVGAEIWGVVAAVLTAISIIGIAAFRHQAASPTVIGFSMLGLLAGAAWIGTVIGFFIGWGVVSQDDYVSETIKDGGVLLQTLINESAASKAWSIMNQVALTARARHVRETPA
jgi:uncharacterized protein (TIGR02284 family)